MIISLNPGNIITPTRIINPTMVNYWHFSAECSDIGGGMMPGTELQVVEVNKVPGQMWVRVMLPGRTPPGYLKITGGEYSNNFRLLRSR